MSCYQLPLFKPQVAANVNNNGDNLDEKMKICLLVMQTLEGVWKFRSAVLLRRFWHVIALERVSTVSYLTDLTDEQ